MVQHSDRPRAPNGRLEKMLDMEKMIEALRKAGGGPSVPSELAKVLDMEPPTVRKYFAQAVSKPWGTPIKGRQSDRRWIFWLEEEEETEERHENEYHNEYKDGMQLICNICGHEFKKGDICHSIDKIEMVNTEEGNIKAILHVCEKCIPETIKKASWDLV